MNALEFQKLIDSIEIKNAEKTYVSKIDASSLTQEQGEALFKKLFQAGYIAWHQSGAEQESLLFKEAIKSGQLLALKFLISQVSDPERYDVCINAITLSIEFQEINIMKWLLNLKEIKENEQNIFLKTALKKAAEVEDINTLEYLLEQCVHDDEKQKYMIELFFYSVTIGKKKALEWLVERKKINIDVKDSDGNTGLLLALLVMLQFSKKISFDYLIERGANQHIKNNSGGTVFELAVHQDSIYALNCLIEQLKTPDEKLKYKTKALFAAVLSNSEETMKWLIEDQKISLDVVNENGNTPLRIAVYAGYEKTVKYLIEKGANIDQGNRFQDDSLYMAVTNNYLAVLKCLIELFKTSDEKLKYMTRALFVAVQSNAEEIMRWLIEDQKVNLHVIDENGNTLLHIAASAGHENVVKYLIEKGANIDQENRFQYTTLDQAASKNHLGVVKCLIESLKTPDEKLKRMIKALFVAVRSNAEETMRWLIEDQKVNIHVIDENGNTLLHIAASAGHENVVKYLIEKGANIDQENRFQYTALDQAASKNHLGVVKCLIEPLKTPDEKLKYMARALFVAVRSNAEETMRWLIEDQKVNIHVSDENGVTLLHIAASAGNENIVKYLIKKGININIINKFQQTALDLAAIKNNLDVVKYLVELFKTSTEKSKYMTKALFFAVQANAEETMRWLIEDQKINIDVIADEENTLLHVAAHAGHKNIVKYLIEKGSSIDKKNTDGNTALELAITQDQIDITKLFIEQCKTPDEKLKCMAEILCASTRAKTQKTMRWLIEEQKLHVDSKNSVGNTGLHTAASGNFLDSIKYLMKQGANKDEKNKNGQTSLYIAAENGHLKAIQCLIKAGASTSEKGNSIKDIMEVASRHKHSAVVDFLKEIENSKVVQQYVNDFKVYFEKEGKVWPKQLKGIEVLAKEFLSLKVNLDKKIVHIKISQDKLDEVNIDTIEPVPERINLDPSCFVEFLEFLSMREELSSLDLYKKLYFFSREKYEFDKRKLEFEEKLKISNLEENVIKKDAFSLHQQCVLLMSKESSEEFKVLHKRIQQYSTEAIVSLESFDEYLRNIPENDQVLLKKYRSKLGLNRERRAEIEKILKEVNSFEERRSRLNQDLPLWEDLQSSTEKEFLKENYEKLKADKMEREIYAKNLYKHKNRLEEISQALKQDYTKAAVYFSKIRLLEKKAEERAETELEIILEKHKEILKGLEDEAEKDRQKAALEAIRKERFYSRRQEYLEKKEREKVETERFKMAVKPQGPEKSFSSKGVPLYALNKVTEAFQQLEVEDALLDLEKICAVDETRENLFKNRERHALLGTLARVMEEVKQFNHKPEWAKAFRDIIFHSDIVFPGKLRVESHLEVKEMALELCAYLRSKPSRAESLSTLLAQFNSVLFIEIMTFKIPEKFNKESLVSLIDSSVKELENYQLMSTEDKQSLMHIHAEGFLIGRISSALSDLKKTSISRYTALLKKHPQYKAYLELGKGYRHGEAISSSNLGVGEITPSQHSLLVQYKQFKEAAIKNPEEGLPLSRREDDIYARGYRNYQNFLDEEEVERAYPASAPKKTG